jgi:vancomycin resistance protein YoaR
MMADNNYTLWVDSMWDTRQVEFNIEIKGVEISKKVSVGMTVKSSNRAPSSVMHSALDKAIEAALQKEMEIVFSRSSIQKVVDNISKIKEDIEREITIPQIENNEEAEDISDTDITE